MCDPGSTQVNPEFIPSAPKLIQIDPFDDLCFHFISSSSSCYVDLGRGISGPSPSILWLMDRYVGALNDRRQVASTTAEAGSNKTKARELKKTIEINNKPTRMELVSTVYEVPCSPTGQHATDNRQQTTQSTMRQTYLLVAFIRCCVSPSAGLGWSRES